MITKKKNLGRAFWAETASFEKVEDELDRDMGRRAEATLIATHSGRSPLRRIAFFACVALAAWGAGAAGTAACEAWPRKTLAVYDGAREGEPRDTRIHRYIELVLNHLGQVVVYHDLAARMAPQIDPAEVGLVVSWFDERAEGMQSVGNWLAQKNESCKGSPKIVAFGNPDSWLDLDENISRKALAAMGIEVDRATSAIGASSTVSQKDETLMDYEAEFLMRPGEYQGVVASADGRSLLRLNLHGRETDLAVVGPGGGYVHASAAIDSDARGEGAWIIDPFAFFETILQERSVPKPDPTTVQGLRAFFATVSSVGWLDVKPARVFGEPEQLASEVLVARLVEPFADLPMSIAVLAGDLVAGLGGPPAERGRQAAMRALAAANVEGAVQGFSDIRDWDFFESYDESQEAQLLEAPATAEGQGALLTSAVQTLRGAFAEQGASMFSRTPEAPRKYATTPFDLGQEIVGAMEQVNALSRNDAPVQLYSWSGNARPFETALAVAEATGVQSMGGGGGLMDAERPSLTNLWPLSATVGDHYQIYDGLSGDAGYTGYWTTPLYGFYGFKETLERTENPRRLKPFHLSFAARSAIHFETSRATEAYLELARSTDVAPIRASAYAAAVQGFQSARIAPEGTEAWRILDRGALQTLRLDEAGTYAIDMGRSEGVMGARRKGESLYVSLDPGVEAPLVALTQAHVPAGIVLDSPAPALSASRLVVESWNRGHCNLELEVSGFSEGDVVLHGEPRARYAVAISGVDEGQRHEVMTDGSGMMTVRVPAAPGGLRGLSLLGTC